jgi:hypothetical protein
MSIFAKDSLMSAQMAPLAAAAHAPAKTYFFLTGETGADLLPRVLQPFIKLGLVPYRVHASTEQGAGEEMSVELRFARLPLDTGEQLASRCRAVIGVRTVMTVAEG